MAGRKAVVEGTESDMGSDVLRESKYLGKCAKNNYCRYQKEPENSRPRTPMP